MTEFGLFGVEPYHSLVSDLHSSDLASYTVSDRPVLSIATAMLGKVPKKIPDGPA